MIELRYYTHAGVPVVVDGAGKTVVSTAVRVLQYRYYRMHDIKGSTFMGTFADWAMEWSDWMDVPEVHEDQSDDIAGIAE